MWQGPEGSLDDYAGYDIRFSGDIGDLVVAKNKDEFFQVVTDDLQNLIATLGAQEERSVEVTIATY